MKNRRLSPTNALRWLGFKQALKGALIVGILAGFMGGLQEYAYTVTYPDPASRIQFRTTLEAAPALGIIYGDPSDLPSPAGYMTYRTGIFLALIASVWGLMTVTRLLRGQEEDGRWELIASGATTSKGASLQVFAGFTTALILAFALSVIGMTVTGWLPSVGAPATAGLYLSLAIFAPAMLFASLGFLASQLSVTRRRAVVYSLVPLLFFFVLRTLGNTIPDVSWLKNYTPFGWLELMKPTTDPQLWWLLPFAVLTAILVPFGAYLITRRDLGEGALRESTTAKPHYQLLSSPLALALRQNSISFISWGVSALFLSALMAQISSIAASAVADSPSLKQVVTQLGGSDNMALAFIGAGFIFLVVVLLLMATTAIGSIRNTEAKNMLDNILVQPVRRSNWLVGRLALIIAATLIISLLAMTATWAMASAQHLSVELGTLLAIGIALTGTALLTIGFGTLLYGIAPRIATIGMYAVIIWSFLIDMISSVVKLNDLFAHSSLFHYISISPTAAPDWKTFTWLTCIGLVMMLAGTIAFTKRDIISE
jgi:ABC-2 type transport system permease protein